MHARNELKSETKESVTEQPENQIAKIARLVADGEISMPDNLSDEDQEAVASAAREYQRQRLIQLVAKQIARNIRHNQQFRTGDAEP